MRNEAAYLARISKLPTVFESRTIIAVLVFSYGPATLVKDIVEKNKVGSK